MNNKTEKKNRRGIRKKDKDMFMMALKKEIFRLARNRDILGIILIIESLAFIGLVIFTIR
jgi:hypothetical protein